MDDKKEALSREDLNAVDGGLLVISEGVVYVVDERTGDIIETTTSAMGALRTAGIHDVSRKRITPEDYKAMFGRDLK